MELKNAQRANPGKKATSQGGFTMLELALAMAIVGLLIVVTVASIYDHQTSKAKKQAINRMKEVAEWLHLQKASQPSFANMLPAGWSGSQPDMEYRISLATKPVMASDPKSAFPALGQETFTLQAVPKSTDDCGTLLLDQSGRRGVTGPGAMVADCWD
jgi:prepilin-type N-terminal cleavage/methylation domain-containing protein